jgi:hypothetical protein
MRYRLNDEEVVSESLDGEVIVVHLQSGTYYSMLGSAADIWGALLGGWSTEEIADRLAQGAVRDSIGADVTQFVATLAAENLLVPTDNTPSVCRVEFLPCAAYATPELQIYTDMQELLLVDPIHEVTEEGWPIRAEKGK